MTIKKVRLLEPGNLPYRRSLKNLYVYDKYIRTPSIGLLTLTTIVRHSVTDTLMYSEAISKIVWDDVLNADVVFLSIFTFNATRGYELADKIRLHSNAVVVIGGLHASMLPEEASRHCDYVLVGEGDETILSLLETLQKGDVPTFPGVAYMRNGLFRTTGPSAPPEDISTIPDRYLLYNYQKMAGHNTIWPQVHASRGCPHFCDYCALVRHFGQNVRTRPPENVVEDIRQAIDFHDKKHHRLAKMLWLTDDNFFADRDWAVSVLKAIIESGISYHFTVQARFEVGFDDEMLDLLKRAGFDELSMGIEFLEDAAFELYHKVSTQLEIIQSIENIQQHGLRVRGLFILGADNHTIGVGNRIAAFVEANHISGVLIQSMYFVPKTPVYNTHRDRLLHQNWEKYKGHVVHRPVLISPYHLQIENIRASRKIYSRRHLLEALLHKRGLERILFVGEYFWQKSVRADLWRELPYLKKMSADWKPNK